MLWFSLDSCYFSIDTQKYCNIFNSSTHFHTSLSSPTRFDCKEISVSLKITQEILVATSSSFSLFTHLLHEPFSYWNEKALLHVVLAVVGNLLSVWISQQFHSLLFIFSLNFYIILIFIMTLVMTMMTYLFHFYDFIFKPKLTALSWSFLSLCVCCTYSCSMKSSCFSAK